MGLVARKGRLRMAFRGAAYPLGWKAGTHSAAKGRGYVHADDAGND